MMGQFSKRRVVIIAISIALLFGVFIAKNHDTRLAIAQSGGGYDLTWNTFDGGGGMFSAGGNYSLGGTIGQPDAGMMSSGSYTLNGGFWVDFNSNHLLLPLIMR